MGKYFEACVQLKDDEIREKIHAKFVPCTEEEFLNEYKKAHFEKYGEEFYTN